MPKRSDTQVLHIEKVGVQSELKELQEMLEKAKLKYFGAQKNLKSTSLLNKLMGAKEEKETLLKAEKAYHKLQQQYKELCDQRRNLSVKVKVLRDLDID